MREKKPIFGEGFCVVPNCNAWALSYEFGVLGERAGDAKFKCERGHKFTIHGDRSVTVHVNE